MNRTFKGKITPGLIILFIIELAITFYFIWIKEILMILLLICFDVVMLERMLHTEFMISSEGNLLIHKSRFTKDQTVAIQDILRIEKGANLYAKVGVYSYLNLILKSGKVVSVWPADETGFVEAIRKKHGQNDNKDSEEEA